MLRIFTASSRLFRRHLSSQVWKQTREQMAANGLRSRCNNNASA
jgi:hypothetical protein